MTTHTGSQLQPTPRNYAAKNGMTRFFTGKPCRVGHYAERYVGNRQCTACNAIRAKARERHKTYFDPSYRVYRNVHRRTGQALSSRASPSVALGCSRSELKAHIEVRFTEGMCWANYGQWEVDHTVPLSAVSSVVDLIQLCHYTNLQPLWKRANLSKGGMNVPSKRRNLSLGIR